MQHQWYAAGLVEIFGDVLAAGLEAGHHRRAGRHPVEVIDAQRHTGLPGNRQQVQHPVGRAAGGGDGGDRVLERGPRHDLARPQVLREQLHDQPARLLGDLVFVRVQRRHVVGAGWADPEELDSGRHGIGGELSATRARAGTGVLLDLAELGPAHLAGGDGANGFEDFLERDVMAAMTARTDGAAIEGESREVEPDERHHAGRNRLVAADDHHQAVEEVPTRDQLDRVGDHFAADERGLHAFGPHGDAVGDGDGVELHRRAAGRADPGLDLLRQSSMVEVTWHGFDPAVTHPDDGLGEILTGKADGPQHGTRGGAIVTLGQSRALALQRRGAVRVRHAFTLLEVRFYRPNRYDSTTREGGR